MGVRGGVELEQKAGSKFWSKGEQKAEEEGKRGKPAKSLQIGSNRDK